MSNVPAELKYTKEHEWLKLLDDGTALIGITDYAQESLGDITFVELPEVDSEYGEGEGFGVVESVKAASDLYMPMAGTVVERNEDLEENPDKVNADPYGEGWMLKIRLSDPSAAESLLDSSAYEELL